MRRSGRSASGKDPQEYISNKSVFLGTAEDISRGAEKWFESGVNQVNFLMPHDAAYAQTLCRGNRRAGSLNLLLAIARIRGAVRRPRESGRGWDS